MSGLFAGYRTIALLTWVNLPGGIRCHGDFFSFNSANAV